MSTHATISIDIILDRHNTRDVLRALLHAILFHRLFGTVKPKTFDVLDVTLPGVADAGIEQLVEDKVDLFWRGMESGAANKKGKITVTLSEKQTKKNWIGYSYEEDVPWESWVINAEIRQPKTESERFKFEQELSATLTKSVTTMLMHTASERGRAAVPPIMSSELSPFPLTIAVYVSGVEVT
ncbi:hypothetical protein PENSPDRAFT_656865 [Peniophora sp. CONT]|nr:hypothetical protein PENSPDRAFT_656865 [Peniophora sp. CONT]